MSTALDVNALHNDPMQIRVMSSTGQAYSFLRSSVEVRLWRDADTWLIDLSDANGNLHSVGFYARRSDAMAVHSSFLASLASEHNFFQFPETSHKLTITVH